MGRRPAHRRGEAAGERQRGDRPPRGRAENASERGESRIVERGRDRDAEQHPDRQIGDGMLGMDEAEQAERAEERADRHHPMAAVAIDQPARRAGETSPAVSSAEREAAHGEGHRPAALGRDQRHGQHRRIEDRAPGEDLGDAEHQDGAPGAGEDIAELWAWERAREGIPSTAVSRPRRTLPRTANWSPSLLSSITVALTITPAVAANSYCPLARTWLSARRRARRARSRVARRNPLRTRSGDRWRGNCARAPRPRAWRRSRPPMPSSRTGGSVTTERRSRFTAMNFQAAEADRNVLVGLETPERAVRIANVIGWQSEP